jgi:hypothetical protein
LEILRVLFRCRISVKKKRLDCVASERRAIRRPEELAAKTRQSASRKEKIAGLKLEFFWKKLGAVRVQARKIQGRS